MIRAIITDVDGVLVGKTPGVNFPNPNENVLEKLKQIRDSGIHVILCTGKSLFSNVFPIEKAHLNNLHVIDGGAIIINPISAEKTIHPIAKDILEKIIYFTQENNIYIELYAVDKYFVQQDQVGEFTEGHKEILQQEATLVPSLLEIIGKEEIIKVMLIVPGVEDKVSVEPLLEGLAKDISTFWGLHPTMLPAQFCVITAHGVSKKNGAQEIIKSLNISFDEVLGIGDTKGDWTFLKLCKYVGIVGDDEELINLAKEKGEGYYFLAPSVEENGVLNIFDFFKL